METVTECFLRQVIISLNVGVTLQSDYDKVCKYLERNCSSSNAVAQSPNGANPKFAAHQLQNFVDEHSMYKQGPPL